MEARPAGPPRQFVLLVATVHAGSLRALAYARSLWVEATRAVTFAR